MGKIFPNYPDLKSINHYKANLSGMCLGWVFLCWSEIQDGHHHRT